MRTRYFTALIFIIIVTGLSSVRVVSGQESRDSQERLILERADVLRKVTEDGRVYSRISGDVIFRRGEYRLFCDDAIHYEAEDLAIFWGNVRIIGSQDTLYSDSLRVYDDQDLLVATGNARLRSGQQQLDARRIRYFTEEDIAQAAGAVLIREQDGRTVTADSVWYNIDTEQAEIYGTDTELAVLRDPTRQITITGPRMSQNLETEELTATLRPILTKRDSTDEVLLQIVSNNLTGKPDSGRYVAIDSVIITRDSLRAEAEQATFFEEEEHAILEQSPVIYYNQNTIRGETVHLYLEEDNLREVYIPADAEVHSLVDGYARAPLSSRPDSLANTQVIRDTTTSDTSAYYLEPITQEDILLGRELNIWLQENRIETIRVSNMARSTYHVFEDSVYQGINETSGDTIVMKFTAEADSLEEIQVIGGTRGTFRPHRYNTSVDTTVFYESEQITFNIPDRITHLVRESDVQYKDMELEAALIDVFWNENLLTASPLPDSLDTGEAQRNIPTFYQQGKEPMTGRQLEYNLQTRRGRVLQGETRDDEGFYTGETILQEGENTLYVDTGHYTTCDLDEPHFHFESRRMKLIVGDLVVARPIVMYIHNVPVFALPFGVFPQQQGGRSSGYILPTWGESSYRGRYLRGLGYYWALSDYWDYRIQFDFWESQGISITNRIRYNKRYLYSGNINFKYDDMFFQETPERNYDISVQHSQTIDPTMDLRIDGRYVSSQKIIQETYVNRQDRLQQQIRSNATLSKRWENSGNSMTLNLSRTENLQNGNISERIPQISFRRGTNKLLTAPQNAPLAVSERWYYNINYSYSANLSNEHTRELNPDSIYVDQYGIERDLGRDSVFVDEYQRGINHSLSFNSPGKILRYISITPSLSFRENWVPEYREALTNNGVVVADTVIRNPGTDNPDTTYTPQFRVVNQFRARHTYNFSINASTKLYGLFNLPFARLPAIRHVLTPSISYNIGPDFSKEWYGYYQYARMPDGTIEKFDRFRGTAAGGTGARETQSISIGLRNLFQAKYLTGEGEAQEENTIDFLTWNLRTGYNFVADEQPWSDIRSSMRASLGRAFSV